MPLTTLKKDQKRRRETRETPSIQSLDRGLLILEAVGKSPEPVSLGQLAAMLGIDRSSAFRLANTLKRRGFLANASAGRDYVLGPSVWRLSHQYDWSKMLARVAHDPLKALAAETNETAHLAVREGRKALFIDHVTSSHVIADLRTDRRIGAAVLHLARQGATDRFRGTGSDRPLRREAAEGVHEEHDPEHPVAGRGVRGASAKKALPLDESEYLEGVRCIAAPIRDRDGAVIASIGISAPAARFPQGSRAGICRAGWWRSPRRSAR